MIRLLPPFLFGLLLVFDAKLPVGAAIRTGDLACAFSFGLFAWDVLAGRRIERSVVALGVLLLVSMEWVASEVYVSGLLVSDSRIQVALGRWLIGIFAAYVTYKMANSERHRTALFLGAAAGALAGFATVVYDWHTFDLFVQMPTLQLEDFVFVDGVYRAMGQYSHPNEAAGVVLLSAPFLIGLVEERRLPRQAMWLVIALAVGVFWITKSRSQAVVVLLMVALWALRNSPRLLLLGALAGMVAGLAGLLGMLPGVGTDAIGERLSDSAIGNNLGDRLFTITESMAIAVQHPFGVGSIYVDLLEHETGFSATHNALLQLAMMGGIPLLLLVLAGLIGAAHLLLGRAAHKVEGWLALYLLFILNVENYFVLVMMSVLSQFLVATAYCHYRRPSIRRVAEAGDVARPALIAPRATAARPLLQTPVRRISRSAANRTGRIVAAEK